MVNKKKNDNKASSRTCLQFKQQQELRQKWKDNPLMTQEDLADWASERFKRKVGRSTVGKILKRNMLDERKSNLELTKYKSVKFLELDEELFEWFLKYSNVTTLSDSLVREKATQLAKKHNIENEIKLSSGWISSFKNTLNQKLQLSWRSSIYY